MRFSVWIPRTPFGVLASVLAGLTIAAILYFGPFGAPSFDAPIGTEAYRSEYQELVIIIIATLAGGSWIGTRLERWWLSRESRQRSIAPPERRQADTAADFPSSLDESLARFPPVEIPAWMRDPATDVALREYADRLASLDWSAWQLVHGRAEIRESPSTLMHELIAVLGEEDAPVAALIANWAGTAVNSLVIGHFTNSALAARTVDVRLAKTWLDILDRHEHHGHTGTVVAGAWGMLFSSTWGTAARQRCWEPFAYAVPYQLFGLEADG